MCVIISITGGGQQNNTLTTSKNSTNIKNHFTLHITEMFGVISIDLYNHINNGN